MHRYTPREHGTTARARRTRITGKIFCFPPKLALRLWVPQGRKMRIQRIQIEKTILKKNNNFILKEYQEFLNILNNESEESSSVPALETELEQLLLEESQLQSQLEVIIRAGEPANFFPAPAPLFFQATPAPFFQAASAPNFFCKRLRL